MGGITVTIAQRIAQAQGTAENVRHHTEFAQMCRFLLEGNGSQSIAIRAAERAGASRVATILRAATDPITLSSLSDYRLLASGFANALSNVGLFDACLPSMKRIPLPLATSTVGAIGTAAVAGISEERGVKVVTRLSIENSQLTPIKAAAVIALSNELLRAAPNEAQQLISKELVNACALAADQKFLAVALSGATSFTSSGSTAVSFRSDLASLLALVSTGASSRLFLAMPSLVAKQLSAMGATSTNATPAFPELGPQGGSISQIRVIVSDACATGTVTLLDASRFAGGAEPVTIEEFRHGSVQMDAAPDSPPTASTNQLSLFQLNMAALLAERWIGIQRLSSGAVASVVNANSWVGGFSPP
jgi:Phage capsid family